MYKTYIKSRAYPVELKFVDGTDKLISGFEKVIFGCYNMDINNTSKEKSE